MVDLVLNNQNFETEVLKSEIPVLVDFFAEWCGPCKVMAPTLEQFATEQIGKVKVGKLDVDQVPELAEKYGVMGIPTLIAFKNGEEVSRKVGVVGKDELAKLAQLV